MANVGYEDLNCSDVGRMLKLDKSTISAWCRKGYINYQDVSEKNSKKPRYLIPQWEFDRIQHLIRKFGKRNWILYNEKDKERAAKEHMYPSPEAVIAPTVSYESIPVPEGFVEQFVEQEEAKVPVKIPEDDFDAEKMLTTIKYIREVKQKIRDLKEELEHYENELSDLRQEVMDTI